MVEAWLPVAGHPAYSVSDAGRVRRESEGPNTWSGRVLTQSNVRGYRVVGLMVAGKVKTFAVHRLVCAAFHGEKPSPSMQVAHGDGDKANNAASNLRWASSKANHADRVAHGTAPVGCRNGRAILNEDAVRIIRREQKRRGVCLSLAQRFGVSVGTINIIRQANSPVWAGVA